MRRTQYPNPDAVPYLRVQPPGFPCQLTTENPGDAYPVHDHGAWLNAQGNGNTDNASGHFHVVRDFHVEPADDGHVHDLTMLPCGVGGPRTTGRDGPITRVLGALSMQDMQRYQPGFGDFGAFEITRKLWWVLGGVALTAAAVGGTLLLRSRR